MKHAPICAALAAAARLAARPVVLAGLLALAATSPAHAQQSPTVALTSPDAESLRVRIASPAPLPGRVQVISLSSGQVLFDEAYAAPVYQHRFCFRNLPTGRYALLLNAAGTQYRYTLHMAAGAAGLALTVRTLKARGPQLLLAAAR
ncbi:hypothetical protein LGH70_13225 [Hymenobacter sp. BT635]|uniref:DUF4397 domain-containing protein n=1 Tax=Hymenobacter nitidus TaxID=2880929 RepID=A0ABS8ADR8_9BACT|nr:hypothetical protein [Hymenobacter nitidus]MCB2378555.1 hypothetical protein [Hymenobacter nitidus]